MGYDDYTETWTLADGSRLKLRHIAPTDFAREQAFVRGLSAESSYLRFHGTIKDLSRKDLEKFTDPDSRNAVALIVLCSGETHARKKTGVYSQSMDLWQLAFSSPN